MIMSLTFTETDFNSNDGMMTSVWGPPTWHMLHTMSFNYPVNPTAEQKRQYKEFIFSLQHVLPCGACRKNLKENLKAVPLTAHALRNRNTFSRWMYRLHEQVNKMLNKKSKLSYNDVRERYENFRARCSNKESKTKTKSLTESGCIEPITGIKSKCVLTIVPKSTACQSLIVDSRCLATRN